MPKGTKIYPGNWNWNRNYALRWHSFIKPKSPYIIIFKSVCAHPSAITVDMLRCDDVMHLNSLSHATSSCRYTPIGTHIYRFKLCIFIIIMCVCEKLYEFALLFYCCCCCCSCFRLNLSYSRHTLTRHSQTRFEMRLWWCIHGKFNNIAVQVAENTRREAETSSIIRLLKSVLSLVSWNGVGLIVWYIFWCVR